MSFVRLLCTTMFVAFLTYPVGAQSFDTSGNGALSGAYFFRYIVHAAASGTGAVGEGCSLTGTMTFDGKGNYTIANPRSFDSVGSGGMCPAPVNGTYGLQSNGLLQLDNPIFSTSIFGAYSQSVLTGSSTEDGYYDMFVAIQAPQGTVSNGSLTGAFSLGSIEFLNAQSAFARNAYFTWNADGSGNTGTLSLKGSAVNLGTSPVTQTVSGATYSLTGNGSGTLNVPLASGATAQTQLVSGTKAFYISSDGNYVLGGSTTGLDMLFGLRSAGPGASNSLLGGTYFIAGLEADLSQLSSNMSFPVSFNGAVTANPTGAAIWHQRLNDIVDSVTYDNTFNSTFNVNSTGFSNDGAFSTLVGANGQAFLSVGVGTQFGLDIAVRAPSVNPTSSVWINPTGIVNAANYTPITNSYAPGELVSIFGIFNVGAQVNQSIPIPTTLGGVQVLVNGTASPISSIGPNQINALIPYGVGNAFATFQVSVNNSKSNTVTLYVAPSAPGVYTLSQNGIGPGAILHANFSPVNSSSPAAPGETVLLFANGLGAVTPPIADGAAGPTATLSKVNTGTSVYLDDGVNSLASAAVSFAGLAPGFPGLYQVNFQVPSTGLQSGNVYVLLRTDEADTEMSTINVAGFAPAKAGASAEGRPRAARANLSRNLDNGARTQPVRKFIPRSHR